MECRQAKTTYQGNFQIKVGFQYNGGVVITEKVGFGHLPIMLMSKLCHLRGFGPAKLVQHKEEASEVGGYFICNGFERLGRLLMIQKRNHPMSVVRRSFRGRGDGFSDKAVRIRCVREDQSSVTLTLYYLQNGSARVGFRVAGKEYLLPVGLVLKALIDTTDHEIYLNLTCCYNDKYHKDRGTVGTQLIGERAQIILDELRNLSLITRNQCLKHIGIHFRPALSGVNEESDIVIGEAVLRQYILVHLDNNHDKFNLLIFMLQKLFALIDQTAAPDNVDALQNMEVLLIGHVITVYIKEKLEDLLEKLKQRITDAMSKQGKDFEFGIDAFQEELEPKDMFMRPFENPLVVMDCQNGLGASEDDSKEISCMKKNCYKRKIVDCQEAIQYKTQEKERMIKVGRLATSTGLDLPQREGLTVQAERLNYLRFISHFRSVHRGASFVMMRTTAVRKLLPESWGFLCPVHTPDGTPCGLLNHMTAACPKVEKAVWHLRSLKLASSSVIPDDLEIGYVALSEGGAYPGLYLFTSPSRLVRPVKNISCFPDGNANIELIGPFEQAFMEITCPDGGNGGRPEFLPATHEEIHPTGILSVVANLTPWSDHNQSPRNMYQCQMAKQTMGFSGQSLQFRADNKTYHLQTPQSPIVRTAAYDKFCMDEFPTGANAIVAVLAYSGYDMEDAMLLNKSSVERGLFHGHIYQTETIDLTCKRNQSEQEVFGRGSDKSIDSDGLPFVGQVIHPDEIKYVKINLLTSQPSPCKLKGSESVIVDYIAINGVGSDKFLQKVNLRTRRIRNPVIGDKFSSRHGQKGVCSQLWPDVDMPFSTVTGMRPDLIINPHAFPSRMTIGMLLESIAAKGGSLHGKLIDATPFTSSILENNSDKSSAKGSLVDEIGPMLASYGFNYHGVEVLYSGVLGTELTCEIFMGPVYYQRLRHMVSDKFQVRSTGPVDKITQQPVGGRKHGGGIRFGEMERDSVLAHGAAYLLHDRLHVSSDYHIADVCTICGSLLTATLLKPPRKRLGKAKDVSNLPPPRYANNLKCHACDSTKGMETVAMPYVFRYLAAELAAMNVKMELRLSNSSSS
ncbi:hypothetical protein HPP92_008383 [Vanilla planifolia]|uniref:DNA-directed RNA polymerase subunit beta n=1 Tax=Vanilla planifolia TaxID=51239 RepID=A0A835RH68_VANPL|nr:hypothetical protein HPP92_008383 [Vanilla planifolia]